MFVYHHVSQKVFVCSECRSVESWRTVLEYLFHLFCVVSYVQLKATYILYSSEPS